MQHFVQLRKGMQHCRRYMADHLLAARIEESFDDKLCHEWTVASRNLTGPSTLDELVDFLEKKAANLTDSPSRPRSFVPSHKAPSSQCPRERVYHVDSPPSTSCYLCKEGDHTLSRCPVFKSWDCSQRNRYVKSCN